MESQDQPVNATSLMYAPLPLKTIVEDMNCDQRRLERLTQIINPINRDGMALHESKIYIY